MVRLKEFEAPCALVAVTATDFRWAVDKAVVLGFGRAKGTATENCPPKACEPELLNQSPAAAETSTV